MVKHPRKKQRVSPQVQPLGSISLEGLDAEKDDDERKLESILFGNAVPLKRQSEKHIIRVSDEEDDVVNVDIGNDLELLRDADLYFTDLGQPDASNEPPDFTFDAHSSGLDTDSDKDPSLVESGAPDEGEVRREARAHGPEVRQENEHHVSFTPSSSKLKNQRKKAAWEDPDDATLHVSLSSSKRLRKLRDEPSEDVVLGVQYEAKLRREYERINPAPQWAANSRKQLRGEKARKRRRDSEDGTDSVSGDDNARIGTVAIDELLTSTNGVLKSDRKEAIEKGVLGAERRPDANISARPEGEIKAVEFHPSPRVPVLMTASTDRRIRLYTIDGHTNPHLQTIHLPGLPITRATFHPNGSSLLLTGPRPFYYTFDLQSGATMRSPRGLWGTTFASGNSQIADSSLELCAFDPSGTMLAVAGRHGYVHIVDWRSGAAQVVGSVKMNKSVRSLWWSRTPGTESELMSLSEDAEVYMWDVGSRKCTRKWKEDGGYGATVIAGDGSGKYLSIGSKTGIVNVYGDDASLSNPASTPKSLKTLQNLTTSISSLRFNHDSQLLVMASKVKKDQMRMVHLPSLTVYSNWPTSSTPLGHVTSVDFSPGSEYLAIGNNRGRVLLYQFPHFLS